jgi:hypothetical protein
MTRATGVGGVFLRAADPEKLHAWYEEHLGIKRTEDGAFAFFSEGPREMTVFAFFPKDTDYFGPSKQQAMFNLRVDDLDAVLENVRVLLRWTPCARRWSWSPIGEIVVACSRRFTWIAGNSRSTEKAPHFGREAFSCRVC